MTTTTHFQPVTAIRSASGPCPVCGKRVQRKHRVEHTVNPFNRNEDGTVRTPEQVRQCVEAEADTWVPDLRHERRKEV